MEVQTLIVAGGVLLTFIVALVTAVFVIMAYINTQITRLREHVDEQNARQRDHMDALRDYMEGKFDVMRNEFNSLRDYLGDKIYDHEGRVTKLESKDKAEQKG